VTVLVVLALVSIALAMSYSIMRSQMVGMQLQANNSRGNQARHAALAGLSVGLRQMRLSSWSGVGTPINGSISATDSYSVTFAAGDPQLASTDPDYGEYPYRVTVVSTGTSVDASQPTVFSTHQAQAVMKLIPRQLSPAPSGWSTMLGYTVYQLENKTVKLAVPCRLEGPVRLQGEIDVDSTYDWNDGPRSRYFSDLNLMRNGASEVQTIPYVALTSGSFSVSFGGATTGSIPYSASSATVQAALESLSAVGSGNVAVSDAGGSWTISFQGGLTNTNVPPVTVTYTNGSGIVTVITATTAIPGAFGTPDYRPFSGPLSMPTSETGSGSLGLLLNELGLAINNIPLASTTAPSLGSVATYRLFPGGPQYNLGQLPSVVSNTTLGPDPVTNPLGLFYASGTVDVESNVTFTGTLIVGNNLDINGTNVRILSHDIPALEGSSAPVRLPSVVTVGDFHVHNGAAATIQGAMYVVKKFLVTSGSAATALSIVGNVVVGQEVTIDERDEWASISDGQWDGYETAYQETLGTPGEVPFFPVWLATYQNRNYVPLVTVRPDAGSPVVHWPNSANPVYAVKDGDSGLHWDLVRWTNQL